MTFIPIIVLCAVFFSFYGFYNGYVANQAKPLIAGAVFLLVAVVLTFTKLG